MELDAEQIYIAIAAQVVVLIWRRVSTVQINLFTYVTLLRVILSLGFELSKERAVSRLKTVAWYFPVANI